MTTRIACAGLALTAALAIAAAAQTTPERLVVGEQRVIRPGYAVGDIAISNPQVCDYRVMGDARRDVMLVANGVGFTTLTLWDQRGAKRGEVAIEVVSREMAKLQEDLKELLRPFPNVSIKALGTRLVLGGSVDTADELEQIRALAAAEGNILCTVVVRGSGATRNDPSPRAADPGPPPVVPPPPVVSPPPAAPPPTGGVVVDPAPPPPVRRPTGTSSGPVSLGSGSRGGALPVTQPAEPPSSGGVAAAPPPPPNVVSGSRAAPASPPPTDWARPVGAGSVEYLVEIYESPTSAPPPEVAGPQGKRLFQARLRTDVGREVRQMVNVGSAPNAAPAQMRGLSIGFTPQVDGSLIETAMVVDTNLPIGDYNQKKTPVWLRCRVTFATANNTTQYVGEPELAANATPTGAPPATSSGSGAGSRVATGAVQAGVGVAASNAGTAGAFIPAFGGLFSGGGGSQPKARPTMLMIVVTPAIVGPVRERGPDADRPEGAA